MKKIVGFDFDGTLSDHFYGNNNPQKDGIKLLFKELVDSDDFDVYVITRRYGPDKAEEGLKNEHLDVFNLLDTLNVQLPKEKVIFTNRKYKYTSINEFKVDIHLDDDSIEHQLIAKFTNGSSVDVSQPDWREKFDELL